MKNSIWARRYRWWKLKNLPFSVIFSNSLCNLHREFALKINQNHRKWKVFQLPPPVSPSSDGIFRSNKFLACVVMSQKAQKWGFKRIGPYLQKRRRKNMLHPPFTPHLGWLSKYLTEGGGGNLLFSTQNLQDSSDCAKNRAPDSSWIVIDDRIWVWSKSPSELGDRAHQSWELPLKPLFEVDFETISPL